MSAHVVLAVLVAGFVLVRVVGRQLIGSLVSQRALFMMPGVLLALGLFSLSSALDQASPAQLAFLVLDCVVLIGFGLARGASLRLTATPNGLWQKGTGTTLVLWLVTIGIRVAGGFASAAIWPHNPVSEASLVFTIGVTLAAQSAAVYRRAENLHIPLATQRA
ncbi:hypothetical protein OG474_28165 [Kribbella sp. NBC_01505]|uniref:hypothetical protein n=1 Tax=Kribbella sp. NBC_01505 TaxID=2903580 RepID=UPI00386DFE29